MLSALSHFHHNRKRPRLRIFGHFLDLPHLRSLALQCFRRHAIDNFIQILPHIVQLALQPIGHFRLQALGMLAGFLVDVFFKLLLEVLADDLGVRTNIIVSAIAALGLDAGFLRRLGGDGYRARAEGARVVVERE